MFFQMFKNSMYICCSVRGKIMLLRNNIYLNWTSLTAKRYKLGLIKNLTNRILRICMDPKDIETELAKMKTTLEKNEYPRFIIDREVNMTIEKWNSRTENPQEKTEKKKVFITLPYTNSNCDKAAEELKKLVNIYYDDIDLNVAFKAPKTIRDYFPYKDKVTDILEKSLVVYHIKCKDCANDYIGETKRTFKKRLAEHRNPKSESALSKHHQATNHTIDFENAQIIDSAENNKMLKIKELLHILKKQPTLNKQLNSQSSFEFKALLLNVYQQE